jgi:hypothetical protein
MGAFQRVFGGMLKKFDLYGQPVSVNYDGDSTYATKMGGCFGLFSYVMILIFMYTRFVKLINKDDPAKIQVTQGLNLLDDPTVYPFSENHFNLGIAAFSPDMSMAFDLRGLLDLQGMQINYKSSKADMIKTPIPVGKC